MISSQALSNAVAAAAGSGISLEALQATVTAGNALTANTMDQVRARAAIQTTADLINQQMEHQSAALIVPISPAANIADRGGLYIAKVDNAAALAATMNVRSYVSRIGVNLAGAAN